MTDIYVPQSEGAKFLKDHLKIHMAGKYPTLTYGLALDPDWTPEAPPTLVVFDDSGPVEWPVRTQHTLRVVVWSNSLTLSGKIAAYAFGQTLCRKAPQFSQILPGTGLLDAKDSRNDGLMVSYTVRARLRVTLVTEP